MKNLVLTFTLVILANIASAGIIKWGAVNVQPSSGTYTPGATTYSAYLYVIGGSVTYETIIGYLNADNRTAAASASAENSLGTALTTTMLNFSLKDGTTSYSPGTKVDAFMVIVDGVSMADADNYLVALFNGTGSAVISNTFTDKADQTYSWGNQESNTAWKEIGAIPEPASMSLLLVGLVGIGLRRKLKKAKKAA